MKMFTYILRSINLFNIALASVIIAIVNYIVVPLQRTDFKYTPSSAKQSAEDNKTGPAQSLSLNLSDYTIIAEQNIFHPDRKIPAEKKAEAAKPQPEFILYGTLVSDEASLAYIEDRKSPRTTQGRGSRQTPLKKGETMSGFTLKEIEKDKIVMVREEETMVVHLTDQSKAKARGVAAAPSAQTQPTPAQTKAEEQKPAVSAAQTAPSQTTAEKKQFASEKEKTTTESAKKTLLDFFKLPVPSR